MNLVVGRIVPGCGVHAPAGSRNGERDIPRGIEGVKLRIELIRQDLCMHLAETEHERYDEYEEGFHGLYCLRFEFR